LRKKKKKSERKKEDSQKRNQNTEKEFVRKERCADTVGFGCCSILGDQLKRGSLGFKIFISIFVFGSEADALVPTKKSWVRFFYFFFPSFFPRIWWWV
jgi:hypothetical protein